MNKKVISRLAVFCLILLLYACTAKEQGPTMEIPDLGLSMIIPLEWKQGTLLTGQEEKFIEQAGGNYCFKDALLRYPYISVGLLSLPKDASLTQYAPSLSYGNILSKTNKSLGGLKALEVIEKDFDAFKPGEKIPIRAMHMYIQKENKIIWVSYWVFEKDFDNYKNLARKSFDSIKIK
ncbi:MAG: hypothetical protein JW734_00260 [Candidatus Omnitrophica bacterium]|nr:hypothetical protein [Candidatus Omnitrophota bacterium]